MLSAVFSNKGKRTLHHERRPKRSQHLKQLYSPTTSPLHYMISCLCGLTAGGTSFRCVLRGRQVRGHTSILVRAPHTACDAWTHLNNNISLSVLHKGNYSHRNTNLYAEAGDLSARPGRCSITQISDHDHENSNFSDNHFIAAKKALVNW